MRVFPVDRLQGPRSRPTKVMVVLALLGGILFAVTAPVAASASPVSQCGYGSSSGNTRTCVSMGSKTGLDQRHLLVSAGAHLALLPAPQRRTGGLRARTAMSGPAVALAIRGWPEGPCLKVLIVQ